MSAADRGVPDTRWVDRGGMVFPRASGLPVCVICAAVATHRGRWCDCPLCEKCARGIVYTCPYCYARPIEATDDDASHSTDNEDDPRDYGAWAVIILALLIGAALIAWSEDWLI